MMDHYQSAAKKIDDYTSQYFPQVIPLCNQIHVQPHTIVAGVCAFLAISLLLGIGGQLICNGVGFLYPAWESFKAIESSKPQDDKLWLTYWVVYAAFNMVELFADYILFWIPFYYFLKLFFLIWLFLPYTKGAITVYNVVIKPFLTRHKEKIEGTISQISERINVEKNVAAASDAANNIRSAVQRPHAS